MGGRLLLDLDPLPVVLYEPGLGFRRRGLGLNEGGGLLILDDFKDAFLLGFSFFVFLSFKDSFDFARFLQLNILFLILKFIELTVPVWIHNKYT